MCGIVGYIGEKNAVDILLHGLSKLEYRGYDSAGIAVQNDGHIDTEKAQGKLVNLMEKLQGHPLRGHAGIGHTRWATHGKPSDANAHPHLSPNKKIAVVHNGIIENYAALKETYCAGHTFASETDTEVVAHLVEHFYQGDLEQAVRETLKVIRGAYTLVFLSENEPDRIIACRQQNPLVLGVGQGENFVASDIPALLNYTKECMYIESGEICIITKDAIVVKNQAGEIVEKVVETIPWDEKAAEKDGFEHFMLKEIFEQPDVFERTLHGRIQGHQVVFDEITLTAEQVKKWRNIHIVACGTAYHSGLIGKTLLEKLLHIPVQVEVASEFRYRDPMIDEHTLVIVISQSGETADTAEAMREAKSRGAEILAITNVVGSAIAREADYVVYLWAGPEISVASTKAYTAMLIALYLVATYLAQKLDRISAEQAKKLTEALLALPEQAKVFLTDEYLAEVQRIAQSYVNTEDIFFIGRGMDWAIAEEGALKLKEISYIHAEAYAAGELKHGTLALVTKETPVIAIAVQEATYEKTVSNIKEVTARDARVLGITTHAHTDLASVVDDILYIPTGDDFTLPILAVIPLQLVSYYTAKFRGCDIDQPRNLAKSVTVE